MSLDNGPCPLHGATQALYNEPPTMLIIALPHLANTAASGYAHVHSDGHQVLRHATRAASTLSAHAAEVVGVIPATRLSWHRVKLPPGTQGSRLQAVLRGALEDRLLEELEHTHLVMAPHDIDTPQASGEVWVGACDKPWLREVLAPLQMAGITVQRLVPELSPGQQSVLTVMGTPEQSQSVLRHPSGVTLLPPNTANWSAFSHVLTKDVRLCAEPAMVEKVQQLLQRQPVLQTSAQRWVQSAQSKWDFAQGEWAQGRKQRVWRALQATWQTLWHAPAWRVARVGLLCWVLVQAIGLNAHAWREQAAQQAQIAAMQQMLLSTFPKVTWVVDAPLQMQREVNALKQASGAVSPSDFEALLTALSWVTPEATGLVPTQLHFVNQTLRIHGMRFDSAQANQRLRPKGYALREESSDVWVLQAEATR